MTRKVFAAGLTLLMISNAHAAGLPSGTLQFLEQCPGDSVAPTAPAVADEALLPALLTPLLSGAINSGLKAWGAKLKESAQEHQVDTLHTGTYFYVAAGEEKDGRKDFEAPNGIELRSRCLLVVSRGARETKGTLNTLSTAYRAAVFSTASDAARTIHSWQAAPDSLVATLKGLGYDNQRKPGLLAVFDIELADSRRAARLVPRFVVLEHSIREKVVDKHSRDITIEISMQAASVDAPYSKALFKFEGLTLGRAQVRAAFTAGAFETNPPSTDQLAVTGAWFVLPELDANNKARVTAALEADKIITSALQAARFAGQQANQLGATDIPPTYECEARKPNNDAWVRAASKLQLASTAAKKDAKLIAERTLAVSYFESCEKYWAAVEQKQKSRFVRRRADGTQDAEPLLPFDAHAQIKEFRKRPVAEFFGNLLSDDTARTGATTALMNAVDPGTRATLAAAEDTARLKLRGDYETALIAAETAIAGYANAKEEDKAVKFIDMEGKKRSANRIAESLGLALPYPSSGTWITLGT